MGTGENAGGNHAHPEGSRKTPSRFMLQKPEISAGLVGGLYLTVGNVTCLTASYYFFSLQCFLNQVTR